MQNSYNCLSSALALGSSSSILPPHSHPRASRVLQSVIGLAHGSTTHVCLCRGLTSLSGRCHSPTGARMTREAGGTAGQIVPRHPVASQAGSLPRGGLAICCPDELDPRAPGTGPGP